MDPRRRRRLLAGLLGASAALGTILWIGAFLVLSSRGLDTLLAAVLSGIAFVFGFWIVSWVGVVISSLRYRDR
jgi:hypothetical protein